MSEEKKTILELQNLEIIHVCPSAFTDGSREISIRFKGSSKDSLNRENIEKLNKMFGKRTENLLIDLILKA